MAIDLACLVVVMGEECWWEWVGADERRRRDDRGTMARRLGGVGSAATALVSCLWFLIALFTLPNLVA